MKFNKWTVGLAAVGAVSLASVAQAEEAVNFAQTAISGTTIYGYVDTSVEWAISPSHDVFGSYFGGIPFRYGKQDGFNLNAVELNIEKPLDETPWASGYHVQMVWGPDATSYLGDAAPIKQAYVTLRVPVGNGIEFKIGQFDTIIGYEVFEAGSNPNFTRSWGYWIEPTEHTGLLATYHINDMISVSAGVANTWSSGINTGDRFSKDAWDKTGLFSATFTAPQSWGWAAGMSATAGVVYGMDSSISDNRVNAYFGVTMPLPVTGLSAGLAFDYTSASWDDHYYYYEDDNYSQDAYTVGLYLTWQATEKLSLNLRGEYAHGHEKDKYNDIYYYSGYSETDKYDADVYSVTATLQYNLWANVISRLELRYDNVCYEDHYSYAYYGDTYASYKDHYSDDAWALYLNIIYKF